MTMGEKDNVENAPKNATKIVTVGIVGITSHAATRDNAPLTMENAPKCHHQHATKIVTVGIVGITRMTPPDHAATRDNAPLTMKNVRQDRSAPVGVTVVDITCAA